MKSIMRLIRNIWVAMLAALSPAAMLSCSEWIMPERLDVNNPTLAEQNPELWEEYRQAVLAYKQRPHKAVFVLMDNPVGEPAVQHNRHLTSLPDSVDYIVLKNNGELDAGLTAEFDDVRNWGTRVLFMADCDTYEKEWEALVRENDALEEHEELTSAQHMEYLTRRTKEDLSMDDCYDFDGVIFSYTGKSLVSIPEEEMADHAAVQAAFLNEAAAWKSSNVGKVMAFMGRPEFITEGANRSLLSECAYIIVPTDNAKNESDISLKVMSALNSGYGSDCIIVTALEPDPADKERINGYFSTLDGHGSKIRSLYGTAYWMLREPSDWTRCGMLIKNSEYDYYDQSGAVYRHLREAMSIMNPSKK